MLPELVFTLGSRFVPALKEVQELLPRYRGDNIFDTTAFTQRFPDFRVTTYRDGITQLLTE